MIALAFGGFVSGWMAGVEIRWDGLLHGLITWDIASLPTVYLLSSAISEIIGGGASAFGGLASAAGSGMRSAAAPVEQAAGLSPDRLQRQAGAYLKPAGIHPATMSPQQAHARFEQKKAQAIQMAKNAGDAAAAAASKTSFGAFADLLIGAIAAAIGGALAVQRRMFVTRRTVG